MNNRNGELVLKVQIPFTYSFLPRHHLKQAFRRLTKKWKSPAHTLRTIEAYREVRKWMTGHRVSLSSPDAEKRIPLRPNPCHTLSNPLRIGNPEEETRRRSALYGLVHEILKGSSARAIYPELPPHVVPYGYPFYSQASEITKLDRRLSEFALSCMPWPALPDSIAPSAPEHYRNLWVVSFLW